MPRNASAKCKPLSSQSLTLLHQSNRQIVQSGTGSLMETAVGARLALNTFDSQNRSCFAGFFALQFTKVYTKQSFIVPVPLKSHLLIISRSSVHLTSMMQIIILSKSSFVAKMAAFPQGKSCTYNSSYLHRGNSSALYSSRFADLIHLLP